MGQGLSVAPRGMEQPQEGVGSSEVPQPEEKKVAIKLKS